MKFTHPTHQLGPAYDTHLHTVFGESVFKLTFNGKRYGIINHAARREQSVQAIRKIVREHSKNHSACSK